MTQYKQLVRVIVEEHESFGDRDAIQLVTLHFVCADARGEYFIVAVGKGKDTREFVYVTLFHAWVREGKIWVAFDNLSPSVVSELVERGIPEQDILMAEEEPFVRKAPPMPASHTAQLQICGTRRANRTIWHPGGRS